MAIGDMASNVTVNGSIQVAVTYTCPQCATVNTTPTVTKPIANNQAPQVFGAVKCSNCQRPLLVTVQAEQVQAQAQQTAS